MNSTPQSVRDIDQKVGFPDLNSLLDAIHEERRGRFWSTSAVVGAAAVFLVLAGLIFSWRTQSVTEVSSIVAERVVGDPVSRQSLVAAVTNDFAELLPGTPGFEQEVRRVLAADSELELGELRAAIQEYSAQAQESLAEAEARLVEDRVAFMSHVNKIASSIERQITSDLIEPARNVRVLEERLDRVESQVELLASMSNDLSAVRSRLDDIEAALERIEMKVDSTTEFASLVVSSHGEEHLSRCGATLNFKGWSGKEAGLRVLVRSDEEPILFSEQVLRVGVAERIGLCDVVLLDRWSRWLRRDIVALQITLTE